VASLLADHPDRVRETIDALGRMGVPAGLVAQALVDRPDIFETALAHLRIAGKADAEAALLRAYLVLRPDAYDALVRLGNLALASGYRDSADRIATRLLARFPGREGGPMLAGRVAFAENRFVEAEAMFREAYRASAAPVEAGVRTLQCLLHLGWWNQHDALAHELQARTGGRGFWELEYLYQVARAEEVRGRREEALRRVDEAQQRQPTARGYLQRARILEGLGRLTDAAADLTRALALQPGMPEAKEARDRLAAGGTLSSP
jgi:tetratricopeptide (TPR) repeat protein